MFSVKCHVAQHRYQRNNGDGNRTGDDTHLRADRTGRHWTFRTDIILDRHVIDNRQNGVDHVACPTQNRQGTGDERRHNRDVFGVATQQLFGNLQHHIQPA